MIRLKTNASYQVTDVSIVNRADTVLFSGSFNFLKGYKFKGNSKMKEGRMLMVFLVAQSSPCNSGEFPTVALTKITQDIIPLFSKELQSNPNTYIFPVPFTYYNKYTGVKN